MVDDGSPATTVVSSAVTKPALLVKHFLYADCPCSRKVLDYLVKREALPEVLERIVLISTSEVPAIDRTNARFDFERINPADLVSKYGVESAPLMVVTDEAGIIRYSGGYTSRKQGLDYRDQVIVEQLLRGESVDSLPVFGCAVSSRLKSIVDPIGLK